MQSINRDHNELVAEAIRVLDNSHPNNPPNLKFGSALLTKSGNIYASSAFWSDTLVLALHAEQAAIAHAAAHNERELAAICCVSTEDPEGNMHCHPCGICKQLIYESYLGSGLDTDVVMASLSGEIIVKPISELMLYPWPLQHY